MMIIIVVVISIIIIITNIRFTLSANLNIGASNGQRREVHIPHAKW